MQDFGERRLHAPALIDPLICARCSALPQQLHEACGKRWEPQQTFKGHSTQSPNFVKSRSLISGEPLLPKHTHTDNMDIFPNSFCRHYG